MPSSFVIMQEGTVGAISHSLSHMLKCGQIFIATKGNLWAISKLCSFMASPSSFPTVKFVEQLF
jgi:hypothetical protein